MVTCRVCESNTVEELIDFGAHPIVNNLIHFKNEEYQNYPFRLGSCTYCGFLQVMDVIDPSILYQNYFTVSSWKNQPHVSRLIGVMEEIAGLNKKDKVLDIGCNDGSFLESLTSAGYHNVFGIEPTQDSFKLAESKNLNVHHGFFTKNTAKNFYEKKSFDTVITRQVLEHISDLNNFLGGIEFILKDKGTLVIEVPDGEANMDNLDYGLWEEHVNYFTLNTLKTLLQKHFFDVVHHEVTLFSGRTLTVFCQKRKQKQVNNTPLNDFSKIIKFRDNWDGFKSELIKFLDSRGKPIIMYGCGARSSNFLNFTGAANYVDCYVDDQIEKQNLYVPGENLKVEPWNEKYLDYYMLLGVNAESEHKVIHKRQLNSDNYSSVLPPSKNLPKFWQSMIYD